MKTAAARRKGTHARGRARVCRTGKKRNARKNFYCPPLSLSLSLYLSTCNVDAGGEVGTEDDFLKYGRKCSDKTAPHRRVPEERSSV